MSIIKTIKKKIVSDPYYFNDFFDLGLSNKKAIPPNLVQTAVTGLRIGKAFEAKKNSAA